MKSLLLLCAIALASATCLHSATLLESISPFDSNSNRIEDALEKIAGKAQADESTRVIVVLDCLPSGRLLESFTAHGGVITHVFTHSIHGFSGLLPTHSILVVAKALGPNLVYIETDKTGTAHLDDSARIVRARPDVWKKYATTGDSGTTVGILDTGIDDSHTDLAGKLAFWADMTSEGKPSGTDENGHGTHVAGIVAGTGAAIGSGEISTITTTHSGLLPAGAGFGWFDVITLKEQGTLTLDMAFGGIGTAQLSCQDTSKSWMSFKNSNVSPFNIAYTISIPGIYYPFSCNSSALGNQPFSTLETYPYKSVRDSFNLFTGMAPGVRLAGIKVMDAGGVFWTSDVIAGIDTIIALKISKSIKVASMSGGLFNGGQDSTLRIAANSLPENGIVFVVSAGNDYPNHTIPDPGLASKVITVGAANDFGQMTGYSCNGPSNFDPKPDVVAPGGSYNSSENVGSAITSLDTNDDDGRTPSFADRNANDYSNMWGTSMACPHVSGLAALIIDATESLGTPYGYSEQEALEVKSLILMTACETDSPGEASSGNTPPLNRGVKDRVEGYGRICADAAIEAVKLALTIGNTETDTLSSTKFGRKAWARHISLSSAVKYDFDLDVPATGDFDLYIYSSMISAAGEPIIAASSINSGAGVDEHIAYQPGSSRTYYIVIKWVTETGKFTLTSSSTGVQESSRVFTARVPFSVYPNPSSATVKLDYFAEGNSTAKIDIFDDAGRIVNTISNHCDGRGSHAVLWDRKDRSGRELPSGIYFAVLSGTGRREIVKVVLLK
jgi:subtilisin family serine protease